MADYGEPLTDRELDVLNCLARGASNREAAQELSISPNTVKVHVRNIFAKLGVSSRTEATTVALQQGILSMPGIETTDDTTDPAAEEGTDTENGDVVEREPDAPAAAAVEKTEPETPAAPAGRGQWVRFLLFGLAAVIVVLGGLAVTGLLGGDDADGQPPAATAAPAAEARINDKWLQSQAMPQPRSHMAVTSLGLRLYQIGGETAEGVGNDLYIYETDTRQWETGAPKLTAVADATAAVLSGEIYVPGGRLANGEATTVVEAYSPLNDGWRPVTSLPRPVAGGLALSDGSFLYLFGGHDGEETLAESYVYDPATASWDTLPPMNQARAFPAGGVLAGQLYVVGGHDGEAAVTTCEVFDPAGRTWSSCPDMLLPRAGAGAAVLNNRLYVIGGGQEPPVGYSEVFLGPEQAAWEEVETPMLADVPAWTHLGVANVETRIYAWGGLRNETRSGDTFVYTPFVYQFFIPAASSSE